MASWVFLCLALQGADDDVLRWAALLSKPPTRERGIDRLSHADPALLRRVPDLDPALLRAAEENAALSHSYGPPRLFSLDGREEELDDLLHRLERGAGLTFQRSSLPRGLKAGIRLDGASAWETLSELGRACSFTVIGVDGPLIHLAAAVPPSRPRSFHGPILVEIERFCLRTHVGFDATTPDFWIRLALWWEPQVLPVEPPSEAVVTRAVDDQGRLLAPREPPPRRADLFPRAGHAMLTLDRLTPPAADAKTLTLEGSFELRLPAKVSRSTFETSGRAVFEGLSAEVKLAEPASGGVSAEVLLVFDDPARAAAYRPSVTDITFEAELPQVGLRPTLSSSSVDGPRVTFQVRASTIRRLTDIRRVHLRVPEGAAVKRVPFRFENVGLR